MILYLRCATDAPGSLPDVIASPTQRSSARQEDVIVRYILDLHQCGYTLTYAAVSDMADALGCARWRLGWHLVAAQLC
jgi:hypothetical protein